MARPSKSQHKPATNCQQQPARAGKSQLARASQQEPASKSQPARASQQEPARQEPVRKSQPSESRQEPARASLQQPREASNLRAHQQLATAGQHCHCHHHCHDCLCKFLAPHALMSGPMELPPDDTDPVMQSSESEPSVVPTSQELEMPLDDPGLEDEELTFQPSGAR